MLRVYSLVAGEVGTNVYVAVNEDTKECVVVDPAAGGRRLIERIEDGLRVRPVAILLTHGHFDHILAVQDLVDHFHIPVYAGEAEREMLRDPGLNMSSMTGRSVSIVEYRPLREGDVLDLLGYRWEVLETPGHTEGSLCFYLPNTVDSLPAVGQGAGAKEAPAAVAHPVLFCGDTLFHDSFGRTDFPGGSGRQLYASITEKLFKLPEETAVYPGHEGHSTIGYEKKYNPIWQMRMWR